MWRRLIGRGVPPQVRVHVLGPPAVLDQQGQPAPRLRTKALEVAVLLGLNRFGAPRSLIMEAIWPDAKVRSADQRLSTCVGNLRHVMRVAAGAIPSDRSFQPVLNTGGHYRLNPLIVSVDWWDVCDSKLPQRFARSVFAEGQHYEWIEGYAEDAVDLRSKILRNLPAQDRTGPSRSQLSGCRAWSRFWSLGFR